MGAKNPTHSPGRVAAVPQSSHGVPMVKTHSAAALAAAFLSCGPAFAGDGQVATSFDVTMGGFAFAKANLVVKVEDERYTARMGYRTAGVGKVVSGAKGEAMSTGSLKGERPAPTAYSLEGQGEKKNPRIAMALAGGAIKSLEQEPPLKEDPERVPVRAEHRLGVVDPLSAVLMPLPRREKEGALGPASCDRTLPVFDGWTRYDVKLSYKAGDTVQKAGYQGPAVTCQARWVPIAGHRPDRESTRFMAENRDMEVTLVPAGDTGLLVPIRIAVMTRSGLLLVEAEKMTVQSERQAAR